MSDPASATLRTRVETQEGIFLVYDAMIPPDNPRDEAGYLAYWNDFATRSVYYYSGLVLSAPDLGQALMALQRDMAIDLEPIAAASPRLGRLMAEAPLTPDASLTMEAASPAGPAAWWQPLTYPAAAATMGFDIGTVAEGEALPLPAPIPCDPPPAASAKPEARQTHSQRGLLRVSPVPAPVAATPSALIAEAVAAIPCDPGDDGGGPPCSGCCNCQYGCCGSACCPAPPCTGCCNCQYGCCGSACCARPPNCPPSDLNCDGIIDSPCPGDIDCDGTPDDEDDDLDGDGVPNESDPDVDGDGVSNESDPDVDGDGVPNGDDPDVDGDGTPNTDDPDADGDGTPNGSDPTPDGCDGPCCGSSDPCCGTSDPCCGSPDPCCGTSDPCCGNPDPCCPVTDPCDPVCGDPCLCMSCNDGDACNGMETCVGGACVSGAPMNCDDGNVCNGTETCAGGACASGTPLNCDDGHVCTSDSCVDGVCRHLPIDPASSTDPCVCYPCLCSPAGALQSPEAADRSAWMFLEGGSTNPYPSCCVGEKVIAVWIAGVNGALAASGHAGDSLALAPLVFPPPPGEFCWNNNCDAFRHCNWACNMARDPLLGRIIAKMLLDLHEDCGDAGDPPQPPDERIMDEHNNAWGIEHGKAPGTTANDCRSRCQGSVNNGDLITSPGGTGNSPP